jgi:two-component sensor histidine kinase
MNHYSQFPGESTSPLIVFRYDLRTEELYASGEGLCLSPEPGVMGEAFEAPPGDEDRIEGNEIGGVFRTVSDTGKPAERMIRVRVDGVDAMVRCMLIPEFDRSGRPVSIIGISRDPLQDEPPAGMVEELARKNDLMLKEIHHRVKNNLQIIESLLRLQAGKGTNSGFSVFYEKYMRRVHAIALIQDRMYRTADLTRIDMHDAISRLVADLRGQFPHKRIDVDISCGADAASLDIITAIPCALIINELVCNSLEHAFQGGGGTIVVTLQRQRSDGYDYMLEVGDNGSGLGLAACIDSPGAFGLELVSILVKQLRGNAQIITCRGFWCRIRFPAGVRHVRETAGQAGRL